MTPLETKVFKLIASFAKKNSMMMSTEQWSHKLGLSPQSACNINTSLVTKGVLYKVNKGRYMINETMPDYARIIFNKS